MPQTVSVGELTDLVVRVFLRHGVSGENAGPVAEPVVAAERDGAVSHGLLRLPGYVSTLRSGWVDGRAVPVVTDAAPGLVATEAANGFAQPALRASAPLLREKARRQGIAAVAIRNSHDFAAVWPDIEPFAAEGFIALAMVNGRQRMVVWGGKRKLLGTSPMAFAGPRPGTLPLVWDQASSVMAQGEILLAARVSGTTSTYVFVPVLCCDDDAICFLRSIFDAAAGQGAAFSPIMIDGALVLPEVSVGMIDASATRRLSMPHTRNWSSTTAIGSEPILQVANCYHARIEDQPARIAGLW